MAESRQVPPPADQIPDVPLLRALGNRRSIRYFDADRTVEPWKIETMLQAARFASCQGNINCTEAIVVRKDTCELWDELEECVSGFNVQIINQASHLIIWLTNLNAWYGRAVDGISTVSLAGATTKYHGWNYEFSMTQTIPRLMSFPTERTEILLRFETGQAVANAIAAGVGARRRQLPDRLRAQARRRREGLRPAAPLPLHLGPRRGLPARERQRRRPAPAAEVREALPRQRLRRAPTRPIPATVEMLQEKGLIQEQAPLPGRFEEIVGIAERHGRDPGMLYFPAREIRRLMDDDDWDLGPDMREHAEHVLATEDLPDYPDEMRETFQQLMEEHGIDASKFLPAEWRAPGGLRGHPLRGRRRPGDDHDQPPRAPQRVPRARRCSSSATRSSAAADDEAVGVIVFTGRGRARLLRGRRRARAHAHDEREARRPHHRPAPGERDPQQRQADPLPGARLLHRRRQRAAT